MIRILGIDPGTNITGFGIIGFEKNQFNYIHHSIVKTGLKNKYTTKLAILNEATENILNQFSPCLLYTSPSPRD